VSDTLSTIIEIVIYLLMAAVVVVLFMGLGTIGKGARAGKDGMRGNRLMRWRVGLQFAAIALLAILVFVLKKNGG
jgi:hypothetical protein